MNPKIKNILEWAYCIIIALVLALLFRYFIGTPTIVKQKSMYPTLVENQRLFLNRTYRITGKNNFQRGDIITFEAPSRSSVNSFDVDQSNPVAIYDKQPTNVFSKFVYYILEFTKTSYIKRVIALPGEHVKIEGGCVYINGEKLDEPYLQPDVVTESPAYRDFIVPEGYIFAMGDNRSNSSDCRNFGCVPYDKIEGKVVLRFWPFSEFGAID